MLEATGGMGRGSLGCGGVHAPAPWELGTFGHPCPWYLYMAHGLGRGARCRSSQVDGCRDRRSGVTFEYTCTYLRRAVTASLVRERVWSA